MNNLNKEELYKNMLPLLIEINNKYLFLLINSRELENIFKDYIYKKTLEYKESDKEYNNYIKGVIEIEYISIIKERFKEDNISFINNYLDYSLNNKEDIHEIISSLRKVDDLFNLLKLYDNFDLICNIIKNNNSINKLLEIIVNMIKNEKKYNYYEDKKLKSLIEIYCLVMGIDLEEIDNEIDNGSYDIDDFFHDGYLDMDLVYEREIRKDRLLTHEEVVALVKRIKEGDKEAINILVNRNLRLVRKIASKYKRNGIDLEDLIQEGNLGLYKAATRFDEELGCKFSTYATWWIEQGIRRAIENDSRTIRIPTHTEKERRRYHNLKEKLSDKLGYEASCYEMMDEYGMSFDYVNLMERISRPLVELDREIKLGDEDSLIDLIPDPKERADASLDIFEDILEGAKLTEKEKEVLRRRYKYHETGKEVGKRINVSRQRVEQIEKSAFTKLRETPGKREDLLVYAEEYGVRNNHIVGNRKDISISKIAIEISNILTKDSNLVILLKRLGVGKVGSLYFVLKYGFKMIPNMMYKYNCISREMCSISEKKLSLINDDDLNYYIENPSVIINELGITELYLEYKNVINNIYLKSNFLERIRIKVDYYMTFNESRFVYILKESKFESYMIVLLILRVVYDLENKDLKEIGFNLIKKREVESYFYIQNSKYKDEIINYLNNKDLIKNELGLEENAKQLIKRT